jgi:hypothetical protein
MVYVSEIVGSEIMFDQTVKVDKETLSFFYETGIEFKQSR